MITNDTKRTTSAVIEAGWGVAIILRQPINGLACYVGEVQATDERGLRVTLIDWISGTFTGMDWCFGWADIAAMEVCTDQHSGWDPGKTQAKANYHAGMTTREEYEGSRS
jgi:hypothetical protein